MIRFRPIPKQVLIHSVSHGYGTPVLDVYQNETFPNSRTITFVRVDPVSKRVLSKDSQEAQLNALLYYDAVNSLPTGISFARGDLITFNGIPYRVETVEPIYDAGRLHHAEIGLI